MEALNAPMADPPVRTALLSEMLHKVLSLVCYFLVRGDCSHKILHFLHWKVGSTFCFNTRMESSLLCNEVWLMSPNPQQNDCCCILASETKQDFEEAFATFVDKETRFLGESAYFRLLHFIGIARFNAVSWIIKSQTRMRLYPETVFAAVNYLDRFISLSQCQGWKCWMFELLSITCLSIAAKFHETTAYPLHEFQEDLETSFAPGLIQRMELEVLKALDWRMDSTTPFSYIHLLITQTTNHSHDKTLVQELTQRVPQLLLDALLDPKFLEFPQFVLAISAVRAVLQDLFLSETHYYASVVHLETLIPQHHKDDFKRCAEKLVAQNGKILVRGSCRGSPSSPVTVLKVDLFSCYEFRSADLSLNNGRRKRKREKEVRVGV